MKKILSLLLICLAVVACTNTFEAAVALANEKCAGKDLGNGATVKSVSLDKDFLVYDVEWNDAYNEVQVCNEHPEIQEQMKTEMLNAFKADPDSKELIELCAKQNKGIKYVYMSINSGDILELVIKAEDLK